jgi:hypothetical protein
VSPNGAWLSSHLVCISPFFSFPSLSVQLTKVLEQMTQANVQLEQLNDQAQSVHEISRLWNDALSTEEDTSRSSIDEKSK